MRRKQLKRAFVAAAVPLVFLSFIFLLGGCPAPGGGKDPDDPVKDGPVLAVTPGELDFDTSTDVLSIEVKNIGNGTLEWWVCDVESCGFADCDPCCENGLLPGETTRVEVSVNRLNLPKNADPPICDEIKIESNGGECVLTLSVEVDTSILLIGVVKEVESGTPIQNATVTAAWLKGVPPAAVSYTCESGEDGGYSVSVESNALTISVEKTGYNFDAVSQRFSVEVGPDLKARIFFDIVMTPDL
jgi:hypothetical protein